jgi:hypothetical protein
VEEARKRDWDVALGMVAPIVTVAGILVGIWQFIAGENKRVVLEQSLIQKKDDLDFARKLWIERMNQYRSVAELAGKIIAYSGDAKQKDIIQDFVAAYWGAMILVEDKEVERAMISFYVELKDHSDGWSDDNRLKARADSLIAACRKSIEGGGPKPDAKSPQL